MVLRVLPTEAEALGSIPGIITLSGNTATICPIADKNNYDVTLSPRDYTATGSVSASGLPSIFMTRATMSSFSCGLLIATISVIAARALLEIAVSPDLSSSSAFLLRKVTNRAAAERLLPSESG